MVRAVPALAAATLCLRESHPVPKNCPGTPWHQGCSSCAAPHPSPAPRAPPAPLSILRDTFSQISRDGFVPFCLPPLQEGAGSARGGGCSLHNDPQHFLNTELAKERFFPAVKPGTKAWNKLFAVHGCFLTCSCFLAGVSTDLVKATVVSPCCFCQGSPKIPPVLSHQLPAVPLCRAWPCPCPTPHSQTQLQASRDRPTQVSPLL